MGCWKYPKGWRYQFQRSKKTYSRGWYKTKAEAKAAEQERIKEIEAQLKAPASEPTVITFSGIANEYLDYCNRKFTAKTYKFKQWVYRNFIYHMGDLPIHDLTITTL